MSLYENYLGRPYVEGRMDCFSLVRDYLIERYGVRIPNFARPNNFYDDPHQDLMELYRKTGFKLVMTDDLQEGDVLAMALRSPRDNHVGIIVEDNQFLHHLFGLPSRVDPVHPKWSYRANRVLRHPEISAQVRGKYETAHLHEILDADLFQNPRFQQLLERAKAMESEQRALRSDPADGGDPGEAEPG